MKTSYDCIPCLVRQTLDSVRRATSDRAVHESVLRKVLGSMSTMDLSKSPPAMAQIIHRMIRRLSNNEDPYGGVKDKFNAYALELYPELLSRLEKYPHCFEGAVRLAIAGNIIDFGAASVLSPEKIEQSIDTCLFQPLFGRSAPFYEAVWKARNILYLCDNAGEIVFDRLLIEQLPIERVTVAVRGLPIINDATLRDAEKTGLTHMVRVIDNGSDAPGTILEDCSPEFNRVFQVADLIISKGQGNYETLSDSTQTIFFLLKAKCPVIAKDIGCQIGDAVIESTVPYCPM